MNDDAPPFDRTAPDRPASERLVELKLEHRRLDAAIDAMRMDGDCDQLEMARLKKRKLRLRDEIAIMLDDAVPDIIA